jgi:hypothetical protein
MAGQRTRMGHNCVQEFGGRIILKLVSKKSGQRVWTGLIWLRVGASDGLLWVR